GICVPINSDSIFKEIENIVNDSACKFLFADESSIQLVEGIHRGCSSVKGIISVDSEKFKDVAEAPPSERKIQDQDIDADDTACIMYTSGTTAQPKGVMLTHGNFIANCNSQYKLNIVNKKDRALSILPLHHAYPLTVTLILPILSGSGIIYTGTVKKEDILEASREAKATVFVAVPQMYSLFRKKIDDGIGKTFFPIRVLIKIIAGILCRIRKKTGINLSRYLFYGIHRKFGRSVRFFASGGARLDEAVARGLYKYGFTILEGYGLTETSPVLTMNPAKKPKIGSVGIAIPNVEIKIVDKNEDDVGEVIAQGPNIMKGYYKRKDITDSVIKDGWFYTGDLGYIDDEGYLFLTGRKKEVIVLSSGVNVYPDEVEEAYMMHAPIREICVFDVPITKAGAEILALWAIVVPDLEFFRKYGEVNLKDVIRERFDNVSRTLPSHMRLMGFSITLEELPHTLLGKLKRFEVKEAYASKVTEERRLPEVKELSGEDMKLMEKDISKKIVDHLKKQTGVEGDIAPTDLLELDLGIDSLGRIELVSGLESLFGRDIESEIIGRSFTVGDLIKGIEPLLEEQAEGIPIDKEKKVPETWREKLQVLPKEENLKKIDLSPGFMTALADFIFVGISYLFFRIFYNLKVEGTENIPPKGPYILYSNHTSYFDGFLVAVSLPRFPMLDLFFVGFRPYFTVPIIRNLVRVGRIIPLDFSSHLLEALRSSYYVLASGKKLCLFPEGIRTLDGEVMQFKKGFGILTKETGAKLVPVVLEGAHQAWPRTRKFPRFHPIKVRFGKPLEIKEAERIGYETGAGDSYEAICLGARDTLIKLKEKK
ncbi:MAG: AMP-binding protein, partial [Candidatus Omnitrophica bacterium]|nr:AMP-binding protein [Candidatus Omnitrophota bacterium]